jgi:hypothetical protein
MWKNGGRVCNLSSSVLNRQDPVPSSVPSGQKLLCVNTKSTHTVNIIVSYFQLDQVRLWFFIEQPCAPTRHSHLFLFQKSPGQTLSVDIVKNYFGESMWRLCSAFQTLQGATRSGANLKVDFETGTNKKTNLSSDGTATAARKRLNLHMVGTYLKQVSKQVIGITRSDQMMSDE